MGTGDKTGILAAFLSSGSTGITGLAEQQLLAAQTATCNAVLVAQRAADDVPSSDFRACLTWRLGARYKIGLASGCEFFAR